MEAPGRAEVEAVLERILASRSFAAAPRQQALLRHIVSETLDGRGDRLKEFSIAIDVFERANTFDPRTDSIVRVQASRLRNQLSEYFAREGASETARIEIPAGGYQATFSRVEPKATVAAAADNAPPPSATAAPAREAANDLLRSVVNKYTLVAAAVGAAVLAVGLLAYSLLAPPRPGRDAAASLPSGPTIFVAQYQLIDGPPYAEILRNGLQYELIDSLSRFPELSVLGIDTVYGSSSVAASRNSHGADFILSGSVQGGAAEVKVTSQLQDTGNNTVVWSRTDLVAMTDASDILAVQSEIAGAVAGQLGQPYGVIQERLKEDLAEARSVSMDDYVCVLQAYEYSRHKSAEEHARVRDCLEMVTQHSPSYSPAWAKLSWMYGDEERYGFNRRVDDPVPPFERARQAAEKAVTANSSSAMAHQYLAIAQFNLRDDAGFRKSIETALTLNPNNSEILADAAQMLALLDGSDRAKELADKAIAMNPGHPPWYYGPLAIYHILKGDKAEALEAAREGSPDSSPMAGFMLAAALRLNGETALANQALESLYATFPGLRENRYEIVKSQRLPEKMVKLVFGE